MKDIFTGKDDSEKENEDEDLTKKNRESNSETTTHQDEKKPLGAGFSRLQSYVKYGEKLFRVC